MNRFDPGYGHGARHHGAQDGDGTMSEMITVKIERTTIDTFDMERISPEHVARVAHEVFLGGIDAVRLDSETTEEWVDRLLTFESFCEALCASHGTPDETETDGYEIVQLDVE